ncbi:uncharacterized protein LOC111706602 isoform X2 [Eurytemora carolleeae]|uniref:uncharacterized protein LOC111706602 isoform X2 n=1 Tax=Eurytemora carolleeae TaxID=1294199 RepID=UPI000C75E51F|nr:uncharacterized protein LOC111706602 isoform X2 [Eurytemora carolleeae]|eukprot:XP_023335293.1 uncharacterized protein LOC111706602 isoform X2 [Eurytemora affinis]
MSSSTSSIQPTQLNSGLAKELEVFDELHIDESTHQIVDSKGCLRVFHGLNFVTKKTPWYPEKLLDEKYARDMGEWGLNVVRLGTMWSGVEPTEGVYDETYLDKLEIIIENFAKHGVWVLLDAHQDVASEEFGTYDGFPSWLVDQLREGVERKFPWPLAKVENWFCGYVTYEAGEVYHRFFQNHYNAVDKFANFWKHVANRLKKHKNIIGYDLLNEPWPGNIYKDGSLLMPAEAGRKVLTPFYNKVISSIREVDQKTLLFWEPVSWSHFGPQIKVPLVNNFVARVFNRYPTLTWLQGISRACGALDLSISDDDTEFCHGLKRSGRTNGRSELTDCISGENLTSSSVESIFGSGIQESSFDQEIKHKLVMSWHYYFPLFVYQKENYDYITTKVARDIFGPMVFSGVKNEIEEIGGGQFLSEFGLCKPDLDRPDHCGTQECNYVFSKADENSISWTYWDTSDDEILWDSQGKPIQNIVKGMSRPYPRQLAGTNVKFSFDVEKKTFDIKFVAFKDGVSELYIPDRMGDNPSILASEDLEYEFIKDKNSLIIRVKTEPGVESWIKVGVEGEVLTQSREEGVWASIMGQIGRLNPFG